MPAVAKKQTSLVVKAYRGDAKTLLAFNLPKSNSKNLAGFTIQVQPPGKVAPYYLFNELAFAASESHALDAQESAHSSLNAPFQKFRWLHVPGQVHQGLDPAWGNYTYTVTPRYFDESGALLPLDSGLSASETIEVGPLTSGSVTLGFTRGYVQSQAYVRHFGPKLLIRPSSNELQFDTSEQAGTNAKGEKFTFLQEYEWAGYTAREAIFGILDEVAKNSNMRLDVFAYDLNEPDLVTALLKLAKQGRIRIILDNASLHCTRAGAVNKKTGKPVPPTAEDQFTELFQKSKKKGADILRGHFRRYSHDKVLIVYDGSGPKKVLTGSTNFSVTGMYVNSNHVLVYDDRKVAKQYAGVFQESWNDKVQASAFQKSELEASAGFTFEQPETLITYSPHTLPAAQAVLGRVVDRINKEKALKSDGSVLFAVMEVSTPSKQSAAAKAKANPVYDALKKLHSDGSIFSYGVSDDPGGISLYKPGNKTGVLVTGKPASTRLPPPFNQVPGIGGKGHQIHHKFVVCGFNGDDPTVFCGSSNLALGGEQANGDNLLMIQDKDIATAFAIEALALVDHFDFLDEYATKQDAATGKKGATRKKAPPAVKSQAAASVGWHLVDDDKWATPYYDSSDLKCVDRELFGS